MPTRRIAIGSPAEASHPDALKAALAEFISMLIFVFAGQGSGMAFVIDQFKTVYATALDPKKGNTGIIAPIAIGLVVGASILAGGAFDGASMNPAVSCGLVYWFGPSVRAAIAAAVYDTFFITQITYEQLSAAD